MADNGTTGDGVDTKWSGNNNENIGGGDEYNSHEQAATGEESQDGFPNSVNSGGNNGGGGPTERKVKGKNEENFSRKIFVGGIGWDTSEEDLKSFFGQFGEVAHVQVKYDHFTGRSRGFAFVEFTNGDACREALKQKDREIKGKKCEVKPAKSRENKKIFIGGLPSDYSEPELRSHFEQYGRVDEIEWPFDKFQSKKKNFAFVVFEDEEAAARAAASSKQRFGERLCDVKIAVPQYMRPQKQANASGWGGYTSGVVPGGWGDYSTYSGYGYGGYGGGYNYYDDRYASYDYGGYTAPGAGDYANWQNYDNTHNWGNYGNTGTSATPSAGGGGGGHRSGNRGSSGTGGAGYNYYQ